MTTELRVLGRSGRSGAPPDVAGLVVVMAVEATGLPATGADDSAFPVRDFESDGCFDGKLNRPLRPIGRGRTKRRFLNLPAAPALSQGFGGEGVAMDNDISELALRH